MEATRPAMPLIRTRRAWGGRSAACLVILLLALLGFSTPASAGGWAVTTLDEMPAPTPGEPTDVGFTIRQHGVKPVDLASGVAIRITGADGTVDTFPARLDGPTGHYVATVVFPAAGTYIWAVEQDWFGDQALGAITVGDAPAAPAAPTDTYRFAAGVRYGLLAVTVVLAILAFASAWPMLRRRPAAMHAGSG